MIKFYINDTKFIGTKRLKDEHVFVDAVYGANSDNVTKAAYKLDEFWRGMNV
jgi:hypothetical protein